MGRHQATTRPAESSGPGAGGLSPARVATGVPTIERHVRSSWSLPLFASIASLAFVLAAVTDPTPGLSLAAEQVEAPAAPDSQTFVASDEHSISVERTEWTTSRVVTYGVAPAAGTPDPGTAQAIAADMVAARGWSTTEFDCLVSLWNKESGWNVYAHNKSSGAYGIPQSLPGTKMASAGADWATNPSTQITWGLGYIQARYGTPCGAWAHSQRVGWY